MSKQTSLWLNTKTLIGNVLKRGKAWHWRAEDQGEESNHYDGPIPVVDVERRLFFYEFVEGDVTTNVLTEDGVVTITDPTRKSICRLPGTFGDSDPGAIFYMPKRGFNIHQFKPWLIDLVEDIHDADADSIGIGSAGLLSDGAKAWVQFEYEQTIDNAQGFQHRPFFTAATAVDGSLATTLMFGDQAVVCDNTLDMALGNYAARVKIRHSKNSPGRIQDIRQALGIFEEYVEAVDDKIRILCEVPISQKQWADFLDQHIPIEGKEKRGLTLASKKRDEFNALWRNDPRVAPWTGTAFGVLQADNTWRQHFQTVKGVHRAERNALAVVTGQVAKEDGAVLDTLRKVLVAA